MRIAFATDEETPFTEALVGSLSEAGHDVSLLARGAEWPEVGEAVAEAVASRRADRGIVCCWTGTGVSIAANRVPGVRAALCTDAETARGARRWNDANVLAMGLRLTSAELAREMVDAFLTTDPELSEAANVERLDRFPAARGGQG